MSAETKLQGARARPGANGEVGPLAASSEPLAPPVRIRPSSGWRALDLRELWRYRELLYFLALRDIQLRYKQTALGVAWAAIQPLFAMLVGTIFFGNLAKMPSDGVPYPLFILAALLPWQLFAYALTQSSNSLVAEQRLVAKVYFPRLIVPLASVLSGVVDFAVAFVLFAVIVLCYASQGYGVSLGWGMLAVPVLALFALTTAVAVGLWLAALNVRFRDVRYMVPFLTQIWMFLSPVFYPSSLVPERFRALYGLNPLAGVIEGFRWALLGRGDPSWTIMAVSAVVVGLLLTSGLFYFRKVERSFADII